MSTLSAKFYLVLRSSNRHPWLHARLATRLGNLAAGEVPLELSVNVPAALFQRPAIRATVRIPDGAQPPVITTEVQEGIAAALQSQLGVRVHVTTEPEA